MDNIFTTIIAIIVAVLIIAFIVYFLVGIFGGIKTSKKDRALIGGKGWYFISKKQTPNWLKHKWSDAGIDWSHGIITEVLKHAKGKHYEYKLVVVNSGHTHDCGVIRRRLRKH